MVENRDVLLDHDYDGIQELDNNLPTWWVVLFWVCIIFGVFYMAYYHVLKIGYLSADEYRLEMNPDFMRPGNKGDTYFGLLPQYRSPLYNLKRERAEDSKRKNKGVGFVMVTRETDTTTYFALTDESNIQAGREIFVKNCASCHGVNGQGDIGPNLTDKYWLHGAGMTNVVKTIKYGFPVKGMISWRGLLKENQIMDVASYVLTLQGTNPPNPKAPQGELVE